MINAKRIATVTGRWNAKPIKTTVAKPSIVGYAISKFASIVLGIH